MQDWRDEQIRYLIHFDDGGSGMRHRDEPLGFCAVLDDGGTHFRVVRLEQPPNPRALGCAWATRLDRVAAGFARALRLVAGLMTGVVPHSCHRRPKTAPAPLRVAKAHCAPVPLCSCGIGHLQASPSLARLLRRRGLSRRRSRVRVPSLP